jgi:hypothetical protein
MENKQTAVEWLFKEILGLTLQLENRRISHRSWELQMVKLYEQAKEMEKQQILIAYDMGDRDVRYHPEQYYNETYGGKDE